MFQVLECLRMGVKAFSSPDKLQLMDIGLLVLEELQVTLQVTNWIDINVQFLCTSLQFDSWSIATNMLSHFHILALYAAITFQQAMLSFLQSLTQAWLSWHVMSGFLLAQFVCLLVRYWSIWPICNYLAIVGSYVNKGHVFSIKCKKHSKTKLEHIVNVVW